MPTSTRLSGVRTLLTAFLALSAFFILGVTSASAAAPGAGATFTGTPLSVATSVTAANNNNALVVKDKTTGAEITLGNDIYIRIPATVNAHFNVGDTAITVVQPAVTGVVSTTVSYSGDKIVILNVTTGFADNEQVTVDLNTLSIRGDAVSAAVALDWSIDGGVTYAAGNANTAITVTATDAAASIALSSNIVGTTQNTTISFTLSVPMALNDTVTFTAPAELDVTNIATAVVTGTLEAAGQVSCAAVGQAVTCTINGDSAAAGAVTIILTGGTTGAFVGTANASSFAVNDVSLANADINTDADSVIAMTDVTTVGTLTGVSFTASSPANNALVDYTIAFTTVGTTMATGAKLVIIFPAGYDLSGMTGSASNLSGLTGSWNATRSGQTVTFTQSGGSTTAPGAKSLLLANVRNPSATGATAAFSTTTTTAADALIQRETAATVSISAGTTTTTTLNEVSGVSVSDDPDSDGVLITWTDPTDDDTSYIQILKGTAPGAVSGSIYATVATGVEEYVDSDVEAGDVVTYQFRTTDGSDTGDLSDEVSFTVGSGETAVSDDTTTDEDTPTDDTTTDEDTTTDDTTTDDTSTDEGTTEFDDVSGHWAEDEITFMSDKGIAEGNPDGSFDPDGNLNRASAAALLWRVLVMGDPSELTANPFSDVDMDEWYAPFVGGLLDLDLVEGNPDGTFQPAEEINRAEFLQMAMNVYLDLNDMQAAYDAILAGDVTDVYADLDTAAWYAGVVTAGTEWGFVAGSTCDEGTCFNAGDSITRAEATKILYNMFADSL